MKKFLITLILVLTFTFGLSPIGEAPGPTKIPHFRLDDKVIIEEEIDSEADLEELVGVAIATEEELEEVHSPTAYDYYEKVICEGAYETIAFPSESRNIVIINDSDVASVYVDLEGEPATIDDFELKLLERLIVTNHRVNSITLLSASGIVEVRVYMTY